MTSAHFQKTVFYKKRNKIQEKSYVELKFSKNNF